MSRPYFLTYSDARNPKKSKWDIYVNDDLDTSKKEDFPSMVPNEEKRIDHTNLDGISDDRLQNFKYVNENYDVEATYDNYSSGQYRRIVVLMKQFLIFICPCFLQFTLLKK